MGSLYISESILNLSQLNKAFYKLMLAVSPRDRKISYMYLIHIYINIHEHTGGNRDLIACITTIGKASKIVFNSSKNWIAH